MRDPEICTIFTSLTIILRYLRSALLQKSFRSLTVSTRSTQGPSTFSSCSRTIWIIVWRKKCRLLTFWGCFRHTLRFQTSFQSSLFSLRLSLSQDSTRWALTKWHAAPVGSPSVASEAHSFSNSLNKTWWQTLNSSTLKTSKNCVELSFSHREDQRPFTKFWCPGSSRLFTLLPAERSCICFMDITNQGSCQNLLPNWWRLRSLKRLETLKRLQWKSYSWCHKFSADQGPAAASSTNC